MPTTGTYVLSAGTVNTNTGPTAWVLTGSSWSANFASSPPDLPGTYLLRFNIDTTNIVLDGGAPITFAALPLGFTPTSAVVSARVSANPSTAFVNTASNGASGYLQFGPILDEGPEFHGAGPTVRTFAHGAPIPSTIHLVNNGLGIRMQLGLGSYGIATDLGQPKMLISGAYAIVMVWWYSPSLDSYSLGADPGGDYVRQDPVPTISSISPNRGPIAGGTAVTILGSGFVKADGTAGVESVLVDHDFPATSVVVSTQHALTCVMPAHWRGSTNVVVKIADPPPP